MRNKVFCIGLNRTGTTSLHNALRMLGYNSVHFKDDEGNNIKDMIVNNLLSKHNILNGLDHYDAFTDWERAPYTVEVVQKFLNEYPKAKFILNYRDVESWIESRKKHVDSLLEAYPELSSSDDSYLKKDVDKWRGEHAHHHDNVIKLFEGEKESYDNESY